MSADRILNSAIDLVYYCWGIAPSEIRVDGDCPVGVACLVKGERDVLMLHPATLVELLAEFRVPPAPSGMAVLYEMHRSDKPTMLHYKGIPIRATNVSAYLAGGE